VTEDPRPGEPGADQRRKRTVIAAVATVVVLLLLVITAVLALNRPAPSTAPTDSYAAGDPSESVPLDAPNPMSQPNNEPPTVTPIPTQLVAPAARPTPLPATVSCTYAPDPPAAKPATPPPATGVSARGTVPVSLTTSIGTLDLTLDRALAPCAVNSFVSLARQGYFDGTKCHRMTTSATLQVLQCGDPSGKGSGGPGYKFADEVFPELRYGRGQIAMANAGPNTNGSQFFMIYGAAKLPPRYTVFGTISPVSLPLLDSVARDGIGGTDQPYDGEPRTDVIFTAAKVG
jgi:peptidyl-prolyl cis-trans isomerase B (cyclophilin B)